MPMTDSSNQEIDSQSSSTSSTGTDSQSSTTYSNRRSQRRRTVNFPSNEFFCFIQWLYSLFTQKNVQQNLRSSSLTTTILNENAHTNDSLSDITKENDNHQKERRSSPVIIDKLVFKTAKLNTNSSYWTVIDRQAEWYKLTIPVNQSTNNCANNASQSSLITPYRLLPNIFERKRSSTNLNDQNEELTYVFTFLLCIQHARLSRFHCVAEWQNPGWCS